jgi:hypothetical protein
LPKTKKSFVIHNPRLFHDPKTRDRCYDFLNIFAEKFSEKIGVFDTKQRWIMLNLDHNIGFREKCNFFCENWQKSQKIVIITLTPVYVSNSMYLQAIRCR